MWILVLMFLLAVPAWAEDLGELSAIAADIQYHQQSPPAKPSFARTVRLAIEVNG